MSRLVAISLLLLAAGVALAERLLDPRDPKLLYADHGSQGAFFNPWATSGRSLWRALKWQLSTNPYDKSRPVKVPVVKNDGASLSGEEQGAAATWVGHATFAIHEGGDVFLTDPHFSKRALLPPRLVPPGVPITAIPDDAFAVISHAHYDHLDRQTVKALPETVQWFVPLGLAQWFRDRGRPRVVELDWWESATHGNWTITCLPSQHWSLRFGQRENATLWCSWLLDSGKRRYYFAGDTGYFHGFKEFAKRFAPIDVAMLPIGAYEPRWFMQDQHMDPEQAYRAFQDLGARFMFPMHWGTFDLTDEPADEAPIELERAVGEAGDERIHLFAIGERWEIPDP